MLNCMLIPSQNFTGFCLCWRHDILDEEQMLVLLTNLMLLTESKEPIPVLALPHFTNVGALLPIPNNILDVFIFLFWTACWDGGTLCLRILILLFFVILFWGECQRHECFAVLLTHGLVR